MDQEGKNYTVKRCSLSDEQVTKIEANGYMAQMQGENMIRDNPHMQGTPEYWVWRRGFLQAHMDSN